MIEPLDSKIRRRAAPAFRAARICLLACAALAGGAGAQEAKITGPVSLVVPYPAGGPSDVSARIVSGPIGQALGTDVIVENLGGATGGIAIQKILNAPADGRLLYQGSQNELIIPPLTIKSVKFTPTDLEIVHPATTTRLVLVVRNSLPAKNLGEFVELARKRSAAEPLSYGSAGIGSLYHLIPESMGTLASVKFNHIPYKGTAPMMQDLIGERVDFTVMAFSPTMLPAMQGGRYRILANVTRDKPRDLASLPSVSEVDAWKAVDYASNSSYFVKKGTPVEVKRRLNKAIGEALASAAVSSALEADGRIVHKGISLADAEASYRAEVAKYRQIVATAKFQLVD